MKKLRTLPVWQKTLIGIGSFIAIFLILMLLGMVLSKIINDKYVPIYVIFVIFIFPFLFFIIFSKLFSRKRYTIVSCPNCKYNGEGKYRTKGSLLIEIILWLCFLLPGIIYTIWRLNSRGWVCPQCEFEHVIKKNYIEKTA